jgi:AcrR family transcriptional regulator
MTKPPAKAGPAPRQSARWRRRSHARPDELLDAARDEFVAKGFDAARIEDIARRAGLSKGAVYLYFASKEELLRALIEREVAPMFGQVRTLAKTIEDPRAALTMIARTIGAALIDPRFIATPHLVISIANRFPDIRDYYRQEIVGQAKGALEILLKRGMALGQFRKMPAHVAVRSLVGPVLFEVLWGRVLNGPNKLASAKWVEQQFEIALTGLEKR